MVWTIPNLLTIARVIAAPLIAACYLAFERPFADALAFAIFAIAAVTDFFDGWLARKWGQVSGFGRMLDPIADKAMVAVTGAVIAMLFPFDPLIIAPIAAILLREVLVSGLREYLKGAEILSVTSMAKWKTTVQLVAMGTLLLSGAAGGAVIAAIGTALLWLAALMTAITGWDYFSKGLAYIRRMEEG